MKNKTLLSILICITASFFAVFLLYFVTNVLHPNGNGFKRRVMATQLNYQGARDVRFNSYYIAGGDSSDVYLGNTTAPLKLLRVHLRTLDTEQLVLRLPDTVKSVPGEQRTFVRSGSIFLADGVVPGIWEGSITDPRLHPLPYRKAFFTAAVPLSAQSAVLRVADRLLHRNVLVKVKPGESRLFSAPNLLVPQGDGYFSTDGMLTCDEVQHTLVYVYYYRNQFICTDTSLQLRYAGSTIDTVTTAQVRVASLNDGKRLMMASPPRVINKRCCVGRGLLFIYSERKADNESARSFAHRSDIDVYALSNGHYQFSFSIPEAPEKITSFAVFGKILVAVRGHTLFTYHLHF